MGPQLRAYLERLPDGLASYPGCLAKASLYRSIIEELPLDDTRLPEPLQDLLRRPRAVSEWIPEVHSHAVLLAQYDQRFTALPEFAAHCYAAQRRLWDSKIYAFMMRLMSPVRLLASTSQRWGQFHRGTELVAERSGEGAGADHVAQGRLAVFMGVEHGAAEPALLGDVDGLDGRGGQLRPDAQALQRKPGAVGQGQHPRIAPRGAAGTGVQQQDVEAGVLEGQREGHAHRAGADDGDVVSFHFSALP